MVWADSAYQSKLVDRFLKEAGYESRIKKKGVVTSPELGPRKGIGTGQDPCQSGTCVWADGAGDGRQVGPLYWFSQGKGLVGFAESGVYFLRFTQLQYGVVQA